MPGNHIHLGAYEPDHKVKIDIIGQPRGIPEKYKARNEILSGF